MTAFDAAYQVTPSVIHEEIEGEVIIFNEDNCKCYHLNPSGAVIWDLLEKGCSISHIAALMAERFTIEIDKLRAHVMALINRLMEEGIIAPRAAAITTGMTLPPLTPSSYFLPFLLIDDAVADVGYTTQ